MKIKIEIEVDTNEDLDEKDALLDLLETIKIKLSGDYYDD